MYMWSSQDCTQRVLSKSPVLHPLFFHTQMSFLLAHRTILLLAFRIHICTPLTSSLAKVAGSLSSLHSFFPESTPPLPLLLLPLTLLEPGWISPPLLTSFFLPGLPAIAEAVDKVLWPNTVSSHSFIHDNRVRLIPCTKRKGKMVVQCKEFGEEEQPHWLHLKNQLCISVLCPFFAKKSNIAHPPIPQTQGNTASFIA